MQNALDEGTNHIDAARQLADRLFSEEAVELGFRESLGGLSSLVQTKSEKRTSSNPSRDEVIEMLNSSGLWERKGGKVSPRWAGHWSGIKNHGFLHYPCRIP